jgi:hypothetical protein
LKRPIAFYLPQFHPIPENDEWWGKGFTEWRNVARGMPQFEGHVQPNLPGELGYYDLRVDDVQRQQVALAKEYGLFGFCFYYYWFGGKRLLEFPLDRYFADDNIDFPFCICWANETWSRRWDGSETDVLVKQEYSTAHAANIFNDFKKYLKDPKYIAIDGKKLLLVYRASDISDVVDYLATWRRLAAENGMDLFICSCLTFGAGDPTPAGFDAAVQFPPHGTSAEEITAKVTTKVGFSGKVYSYPSVVANQIADSVPTFPLFRGVMPSWDNTARRLDRAHIFADHSPALFSIWLNDAFAKTFADKAGNKYVFINAWNEWAEGAYIEPDAQNGTSRLLALKTVVEGGSHPDLALKTLRSLAEITGGSASQIVRQSVDTLEQALSASYAVLEELRSLVAKERSPYELFMPILPTNKPWLSTTKAVFLPGAIGSFDRLGSVAFQNGIRVGKKRTLYASGWVLPQAFEEAGRKTHFMLILSDEGGRSFFYESIHTFYREDVAKHLSDWPLELAANSGFQMNIDVEHLPPGNYIATVGVACGDTVYLVNSRQSLVILADVGH